jgi:hypothetical protein
LQAPEVQKRQGLPDGLNLSALLGDETAAIAQISSLLTNPTFASVFTSITANPAFQSSVSAELVSQYGSSSAAAALSQYRAELGSLVPSSGASSAAAPTQTSSGSSMADGSTAAYTIPLMGSVISLTIATFLFAM